MRELYQMREIYLICPQTTDSSTGTGEMKASTPSTSTKYLLDLCTNLRRQNLLQNHLLGPPQSLLQDPEDYPDQAPKLLKA
jgi:hypothetical protein